MITTDSLFSLQGVKENTHNKEYENEVSTANEQLITDGINKIVISRFCCLTGNVWTIFLIDHFQPMVN